MGKKSQGEVERFTYKNRTFIVDHLDNGTYLVTEGMFIISSRGDTQEEAVSKVKECWDSVEHKYKNFKAGSLWR